MAAHVIGDVTIDRVEENAGPSFLPGQLYPDWTPEALERHRHWMVPRAFHERSGRLVMSLHSWILRTGRHTVIIDTCVGNCKARSRKMWNNLDIPFLERLAAQGVRPEEVDYVLCTHLHTDHVGWNTRLEDGRWVPTFPNAKYLIGRLDYDYWTQRMEVRPEESPIDGAFEDSVLPIVEAGQAVMVGDGYRVDDTLLIEAAPGHTPGHVTVSLTSGGREALFVGDIMHHPIQVHEPHWNSAFCEWPDHAAVTRRHVLERLADRPTLMLPAHFPDPCCGYVLGGAGGGFRFAFAD